MKRDQNCNALVAAALSLLISLGGIGCMVTGLKLPVSGMAPLVLACLTASLLFAGCYRLRCGSWIIRGLGGLLLARAILQPETTQLYLDQLRAMLNRMTTLWNNAYGWGVIPAGEAETADQPLMVIGIFVALAVCRTVCRRKRAFFPVMIGLLPLWSCLVVTDTVPGGQYLFLLLLGLTVLVLTNSVRRSDLRQSLELTAMAFVAGAAGLALLFACVPRKDYVNQTGDIQQMLVDWAQDLPTSVQEWSQQTGSGEVQTVQPQRENLSTLGDRIERDTPVLYVTAQEDGLLYLRGQDFDSYDGTSWQATRNRTEMFPLLNSMLSYGTEAGGEIAIDARRERSVLYLPYYPATGVQVTGGRVTNEEGLVTYSFNHRKLPDNWREQVNGSAYYDNGIYTTAGVYDPSEDRWRYRILPLDTQERAKELLKEILPGDGGTATGIADAIAEYVCSSAEYSLTPGSMPAGEADFALWFLEDSDRGYCVHFATAAAVLLRAAGVDARYVTGYVLHADAGQTVTVTARQSHAWVEYFEPRLGGWVVLEATPSDALAGQIIGETVPGEEPTEPEATDPASPSRSPEAASTAPTEADRNGGGEEKETPVDLSGLFSALKWLLGLALAAAAVPGQRRLRLSWRRKGQADPDPNTRALALWREAELLHRLLKQPPPEALEALAQKAKFSQYTLTDGELAAFRTDIRHAAESLRACPWYLRLLHQYIFAAY